jgi:hypothetical protein
VGGKGLVYMGQPSFYPLITQITRIKELKRRIREIREISG